METKFVFEDGSRYPGPAGSYVCHLSRKGEHDPEAHGKDSSHVSVQELGVASVMRHGMHCSPAKIARHLNRTREADRPGSPMLNREQVRNALRKSSAPRLSQAIHSARHCAAGAFIRHDTTAWASMAAHVSLKDAGHRRATYAELHAYLTQLQRRLPWAVIYITSFSDFSFGVLLGSKNWSAECPKILVYFGSRS